MTSTARRVLLGALAVVLVGLLGGALLALGPRLAIPDEAGRAVDVAPVVVTPVPTPPPADPAPVPAQPPAPVQTPSESPDDGDDDGATVVPGPEPVEVGDDNGGDDNDDDGGGSGRDHPEDD
ncbi:hypothetical protein ACFDTO_31665 [Microbacteriaceae bacterium 4G12]